MVNEIMAAPDDKLYEYAVIRYVPRVDREEFVNIGLVMMNKRHKWMKALIILDEERIRALYPDADLDSLKRQSRLFELKDVPSVNLPVEEKYRWITSVKSACLQVSPSHPGLLTTVLQKETDTDISHAMEVEFDRLFHSLIL